MPRRQACSSARLKNPKINKRSLIFISDSILLAVNTEKAFI
jgi:hypothetical protein